MRDGAGPQAAGDNESTPVLQPDGPLRGLALFAEAGEDGPVGPPHRGQ
ncbi:MAG TPA: hypothetical protein VMM83_03275 [Longimicrobiales bacterium]|nr:hypothetical protein [Longimicrobiales bacterium]